MPLTAKAGQGTEVTNGDERLPPEAQASYRGAALDRVSTMPFGQVADDRIALIGTKDAIEEAYPEHRRVVARHGASSPTSSPAAMRRSAKRFSRSARLPAAVTE